MAEPGPRRGNICPLQACLQIRTVMTRAI